jgi:SAM-dependent methyltransferase
LLRHFPHRAPLKNGTSYRTHVGLIGIPAYLETTTQEKTMRVGVIPETFFEWLLVKFNIFPAPLLESHIAFLIARMIMIATKIGAFEVLKDGPRTAEEVAKACSTQPNATERLLNALVSAKYLRAHQQGYALRPTTRKWLLKDSPHTMRNKMLLHFAEWDITEVMDDFVQTGKAADLHGSLDAATWGTYQRAMKELAHTVAAETSKRAPVPSGATRLLDIGGSHGLYSVEFCRRHQGLSGVVLDLPEAVQASAPLLAEEKMGASVVHRAGNALTDDLGESAWDVIFVSALMHHFSAEQNRSLSERIARALKPSGVFIIQEQVRTASRFDAEKPARHFGAFLDLYFAATSSSGTWSIDEMQAWQKEAGLKPASPIWSRIVPGIALVVATKA